MVCVLAILYMAGNVVETKGRSLEEIEHALNPAIYTLRPRCVVFDALVRCTRLARLWDLYAITSCPSRFSYTNPTMRLLNEYFGLLVMVSCSVSASSIEDGSFTLSNEDGSLYNVPYLSVCIACSQMH
ncbi:hypothetical protein RHSIM_Rhsim01G0150300 [Rhododendron simsii]|uniref:Uncharacterized protein n=1 Tax=Rhododendron simsii TaxID=118357 RepID=A0A834LZE4_RHOSS|nr:hypothetical protein RHSIM_Rhsim01G0150300 [Rhododendron simsii]